ncbi:MAG TPA: hypothetical protein VMV05_10575 [bacterium]|nr:hypothetical protein [bacterium]
MAPGISGLSYLAMMACDIAAFLLLLEWLVHLLPGAGLNPLRRSLFLMLYPLLKFSDRFLSFKWPGGGTRGLLAALILVLISRYGLPWLVLFSFSLRG